MAIKIGDKFQVMTDGPSRCFSEAKKGSILTVSGFDSCGCPLFTGDQSDNGWHSDWFSEGASLLVGSTKIKLSPGAQTPTYGTPGAAGFDLYSNEEITINPSQWAMVHTGVFIQLPEGHEMQIRSRSGMAARQGLIVHQGVGTIDEDYRGEIIVMLRNVGMDARTVRVGDRIAQGVVAKVERLEFQVVEELDETERGEGGFGSTGV